MGRRILRGLVVWALAGCRIGFDATGGSPIDVAPSDGDGAILDAAAPFGAPGYVVELDAPEQDYDPALPADQLEIYFCSLRAGGTGSTDLWRATRTSTSVPWSVPTPVVELNSGSQESDPDVSPDGLTIVFASARAGGAGSDDLYISTRSSRLATWNAPQRIVELATPMDEVGPALSADMLSLYFHAGPAAPFDIYMSTRATVTATWGPATKVTELSSGADDDGDPRPINGGHVIVFGSDRTGGTGGFDLWQASRADVSMPFDPPVVLSELNTAASEAAPWISEDQRVIYFVSDRLPGNRAIYMATR